MLLEFFKATKDLRRHTCGITLKTRLKSILPGMHLLRKRILLVAVGFATVILTGCAGY